MTTLLSISPRQPMMTGCHLQPQARFGGLPQPTEQSFNTDKKCFVNGIPPKETFIAAIKTLKPNDRLKETDFYKFCGKFCYQNLNDTNLLQEVFDDLRKTDNYPAMVHYLDVIRVLQKMDRKNLLAEAREILQIPKQAFLLIKTVPNSALPKPSRIGQTLNQLNQWKQDFLGYLNKTWKSNLSLVDRWEMNKNLKEALGSQLRNAAENHPNDFTNDRVKAMLHACRNAKVVNLQDVLKESEVIPAIKRARLALDIKKALALAT